MSTRRFVSALAALLAGVTLFAVVAGPASAADTRPATVHSQRAAAAVTQPITGTFTDALGGVGNFAGNFTLNRVVNNNGVLSAVGTITGTLTNSLGAVVGTVSQQVTVPISLQQVACPILHLVLGPLDLNLLGLTVHLDQVVLDITAVPGPGNLLGNLLCAVAHLLDPSNVSGLAAVLNFILGLLH